MSGIVNEIGSKSKIIDGNVGIGKTPTNKPLEVYGTTNPAIRLQNSTTGSGSSKGLLIEMNGSDVVFDNYESGAIKFETSNSTRMTIDSSGDINTAGSVSVGDHLHIATTAFSAGRRLSSSSSGITPITLYWGDLTVTTSSDVRLKDNIVDTEINGLEKLNQLAVKDFTWNDPSDKGYNNRNVRGKWTGLIAQEVIDILPFCVHAPRDKETLETLPDAVDEEDGETIIPWRMEFGYMVPVLIKAIQELSAKVTALENA